MKRTTGELYRVFTQINNDCAANHEPVIPLTDAEYYAQAICDSFDEDYTYEEAVIAAQALAAYKPLTLDQLIQEDPEMLLRAWAKQFVLSQIAYTAQCNKYEPSEKYLDTVESIDGCVVDALHDDTRSELRNYAEEYAKEAGLGA